MATPLISVIIDTFNHERYIERAVSSVLDQEFPTAQREIVVVDDGSTDRTPEILKQFEDRVRLIRKPNGGQASAFNAAIAATHADIVAFLDGDDWWAPGKLTAVAQAFEKDPGIAAVGHGFYEVIEDAPPAEIFVPGQTRRLDLSSVEAARITDLGRTLLGTSRLAVRRSVLDRLGPIPDQLVFCADTPILTTALALGGALVLDQPLCYYRIHGSSLFSIRNIKTGKFESRAATQRFLMDYLPKRLAEFGVAPEIVAALFESDRLELERTESFLGQRSRWDSLRTELREIRRASAGAGPAYSAFKSLVAVAAVVMPPTTYQRLRLWYGTKNFKQFRDKLAPTETPAEQAMFRRRPIPRPD